MFVLGNPLDVGGAERQLLLLLPALHRAGLQVMLLCLASPGSLAPEMVRRGVRVHALPRLFAQPRGSIGKKLRAVAGFLAVLWHGFRWRPEVLHMFSPTAYAVAGFASLLLPGVTRVMSRRGMNRYLEASALASHSEHFLHHRMDVVLANAERVAEELLAEGVPLRRLGIIHNGIDMSRFSNSEGKADLKKRLGLSADTLVLVKVANLWPYKGHRDLLIALQGFDPGLDWRLLLIGRDHGLRHSLMDLSHDLGIEERVLFLGPLDDVDPFLMASDIGILASHEEGLSNALIEYLAAGLAVVATDVGGNVEAVGEAGVIIPARQPTALRGALQMLADPYRREGLRGAAIRKAADFNAERCVQAHVRLYDRLVSHAGLPDDIQYLPTSLTGLATRRGGSTVRN